MTTSEKSRGVYQRVTDAAGTTYLIKAVPAGHLDFPVYIPQGGVEALIQTVGVTVVNRLVFRGGWTVLAWRSDVYAPKRERLHKERFAGRTEAMAAYERLADKLRGAS